MPFREAIRLAFQVIWSHKMKSGFSAIGVFIGVMFLIAVVSILEGINRYMTDQVVGTFMGVNTFQLRQRPDFTADEVSADTRREWRRRPPIEYDDARAVVAGIGSVPFVAAWTSVNYTDLQIQGRTAPSVRIVGATEDYFDVKG